MKVRSDHRSEFSNLCNWKLEGFQFPIAYIGKFTAMITSHFHLDYYLFPDISEWNACKLALGS